MAYCSNSPEQAVTVVGLASEALWETTMGDIFLTYTMKRVRVSSRGAEYLVANDVVRLG
jgi:hypothetical protein